MMTWKMEEKKILILQFEPFCAAFEHIETWKTQKTITGLSVWMLGLATMSVRTPKRQGNPTFERYQILLKNLSQYFGHNVLLWCPIELIFDALEIRFPGIQLSI